MVQEFTLNGCIRVSMRIFVERLVEMAFTSIDVVVDVSTVALREFISCFYTR